MLYSVIKSANRKIGPIAATYRTIKSCPNTCAFRDNGCYATGRLFGIANRGKRNDIKALGALFKKLVHKAIIRHHVSGDVMAHGIVDKAYVDAIAKEAKARPDVMNILYTHAWRQLGTNPFPFVANASCETVQDIEDAVKAGWEATIVVNEKDPLIGQTVAGKKIIQCPQEYMPGMNCAKCRLCARPRRSIVAFVIHGIAKKKAQKAIAFKRS